MTIIKPKHSNEKPRRSIPNKKMKKSLKEKDESKRNIPSFN